MAEIVCCEMVHENLCNNQCDTQCVQSNCNVNICNDTIELCVFNPKKNTKVNMCLSESKFKCLIKSVSCHMECNLKIVGALLVSTYIFIFVQLGRKTKKNTLCVIHGHVDTINNIINQNTLKIQMCYNIYLTAKSNNINSSDAKNLKIVCVTYNPVKDVFVLLFNNNHKTMIGKIENLEAIHTIGTMIEFVSLKCAKTHTNCILTIEHDPKCIIVLSDGKYKLFVWDCNTCCDKAYKLCF